MALRKVDESSLISVADAIRTKGGTTEQLVFPDGYTEAIAAIKSGGAPNGTEWTQSNITNTYASSCVKYHNGVWVCTKRVGRYASAVLYSIDGKAWIETTASSDGWTKIECGNGVWIVCGESGGYKKYLRSTDGKNWEEISTDDYLRFIKYGGGTWIMSTGKNSIYYSTNAKDWIAATAEDTYDFSYAFAGDSATYSDAAGWFMTQSPYSDVCYYSTDEGRSWAQSTLPVVSGAVLYADGVYLCVPCTGSNNSIHYSLDFTTWTACSGPVTGCFAKGLVIKADGVWTACERVNGTIIRSSDGITWETVSEVGETGNFICYANGIYLLGTGNGIYYSVDCINWSQTNIASGYISQVPDNANGIWVAASPTSVYYSVTWESV